MAPPQMYEYHSDHAKDHTTSSVLSATLATSTQPPAPPPYTAVPTFQDAWVVTMARIAPYLRNHSISCHGKSFTVGRLMFSRNQSCDIDVFNGQECCRWLAGGRRGAVQLSHRPPFSLLRKFACCCRYSTLFLYPPALAWASYT